MVRKSSGYQSEDPSSFKDEYSDGSWSKEYVLAKKDTAASFRLHAAINNRVPDSSNTTGPWEYIGVAVNHNVFADIVELAGEQILTSNTKGALQIALSHTLGSPYYDKKRHDAARTMTEAALPLLPDEQGCLYYLELHESIQTKMGEWLGSLESIKELYLLKTPSCSTLLYREVSH